MSTPLYKASSLIVSIVGLFFTVNTRAQSLGISLNHTFSGKPLILDSLRYENSTNETFSISRLSYLISEFELQDIDGNWQKVLNSIQWIDAKKHRAQILLDSIPEGDFKAIRFNIGLSEAVNHSDPNLYAAKHPLNPSFNNLHWNWQTGYIFLALEGTYRQSKDQVSGYVYHFANDSQRTTITLALPRNISANTELDIDFDIASLLNVPSPISFSKDGASTHSREGDPIPLALKRNLPGAFQIKRIRAAAPMVTAALPLPIDLPDTPTPYPFKLSNRLPIPSLPLDNPLIAERIELGRLLFHDPQLSIDNTVACASCHQKDHAFSDPARFSAGVNDQFSRRHSMPLFNLAWKDSFFWDGRAQSLREQVLIPIEDPREMGESMDHVIEKLSADADYPTLFNSAFGSASITPQTIGLALENFLLSLTSYDSKFDQAMSGKAQLSPSEQRGFELFMTEFEPRSRQYGADCFHCHGGALFTDNRFHDNGLAQIAADRGLAEVTRNPMDANKFSTPSLRNIALTAPYMHDGRFQTLEEVVEHYSSAITSRVTLDPNLAKHPTAGLQLSAKDKTALVDFLKTLSDPQYIQN